MTDLIQSFLGNIATEAFSAFDAIIQGIFNQSFYIENFISDIFGSSAVADVYNYIYITACSLFALKFLQRGFSIYILWRDGDADSSPRDMVMGAVQGVVVAATFPFIYDFSIETAIWFYENILRLLNLTDTVLLEAAFKSISSGTVFTIVVILIYVVAGFILWLQIIKRGFELLILRLGLPIACIGLINSDGGVFKPYVSTIIKSVLTLVVQSLLMCLSFRMIITLNTSGLLVGIAALMTAYSVPALFQQFLVSGQGMNVTNKIYSTARLMQMAKGAMK